MSRFNLRNVRNITFFMTVLREMCFKQAVTSFRQFLSFRQFTSEKSLNSRLFSEVEG